MNLTPVQQQIVDTPGNLIVRASAGTGKTHTMVAKIATEIEHKKTRLLFEAGVERYIQCFTIISFTFPAFSISRLNSSSF